MYKKLRGVSKRLCGRNVRHYALQEGTTKGVVSLLRQPDVRGVFWFRTSPEHYGAQASELDRMTFAVTFAPVARSLQLGVSDSRGPNTSNVSCFFPCVVYKRTGGHRISFLLPGMQI